jgi:hypothetical protein
MAHTLSTKSATSAAGSAADCAGPTGHLPCRPGHRAFDDLAMTTHTNRSTARPLTIAGWLLVAASIAFSLVIASMVGSLAAAGFPAEEPITRAAIDPIAFWRSAVAWTFVVPIALAAAGSATLAVAERSGAGWLGVTTIAVWVLAVVAAAFYAVSWQMSLDFTTTTILDDPARDVALEVFGRVAMPLAALGSAGAALCLRRIGAKKRAPLVVAVLAVVIAIAFALGVHAVAPVPPAVLIAVWIPLGVGALRQSARTRGIRSLRADVSA